LTGKYGANKIGQKRNIRGLNMSKTKNNPSLMNNDLNLISHSKLPSVGEKASKYESQSEFGDILVSHLLNLLIESKYGYS
jgi:hypothetical protein